MKKYLFLMLFISAMAVSCARQEDGPLAGKVYKEFRTSVAKTSLSGSDVVWEANDEMSIFGGIDNNRFSTASSGAVAVFTGMAEVSDNYYALYPYQEEASFSGGVISASVPVEQYARPDNFGSGANVSVARALDNTLAMKNVCGYVKFNIAEENRFTELTVSSAGGEKIAGKVGISIGEDGTPSCTTTDESSSYVKLVPELTATFQAGNYYVCLVPTQLSKGLVFIFKDTEGNYLRKEYSIIDAVERRVPINIGNIDSHAAPLGAEITLAPDVITDLYPTDTSAVIKLVSPFVDIAGSIKSGATLSDVKLTKVSDTEFKVDFKNPNNDPQLVSKATFVFSATGASNFEVTLQQRAPLFLDFTDSNPYSIPSSEPSAEFTFSVKASSTNTYDFKAFHCYYHSGKRFIFKGGSKAPWGYVAFPAIPGLKLQEVIVHTKFDTSNDNVTKLYCQISNYDTTDGFTYADKISIVVSASNPVKEADYVLTRSEAGVSYKLVGTQNVNGFIKDIKLVYVE